jgi:hypothetical protein
MTAPVIRTPQDARRARSALVRARGFEHALRTAVELVAPNGMNTPPVLNAVEEHVFGAQLETVINAICDLTYAADALEVALLEGDAEAVEPRTIRVVGRVPSYAPDDNVPGHPHLEEVC